MMDNASVGIAIGDVHGGLSYANKVLLGWRGYGKKEMESAQIRWMP